MIPPVFASHCEWHHRAQEVVLSGWKAETLERKIFAGALALGIDTTSAITMMTEFGLCMYAAPALKRLISNVSCILFQLFSPSSSPQKQCGDYFASWLYKKVQLFIPFNPRNHRLFLVLLSSCVSQQHIVISISKYDIHSTRTSIWCYLVASITKYADMLFQGPLLIQRVAKPSLTSNMDSKSYFTKIVNVIIYPNSGNKHT